MGVPLLSFKYIHLYIKELGFLLILYQYLIIRFFLLTDKGNLANSPYIVGLEVLNEPLKLVSTILNGRFQHH